MDKEGRGMRVYGIDGIVESFDDEGQCLDSERYSLFPRNACGYCGRVHPTKPEGWRNERGEKVPCEECERRTT